jgi:protoheme IX farnesyltransferase
MNPNPSYRTDAEAIASPAVRIRSRVMDYVELTKPELTFLSVLTTLCGLYLGMRGRADVWLFFHAAMGTMLVGGGAGALNQFIERAHDGQMKRTERRPLPSGRLKPIEALFFGSITAVLGVLQVTFFINPLTGLLALATLATYLLLYTPLKRVTPWATVVGAIPGALPAMAGWTAARGEVAIEAWVLFGILFFWQMPHFYSLAWMYKRDYARAGYRMLTAEDATGRRTGAHIVAHALFLLPASLAPAFVGLTGTMYLAGSLVLGAAFVAGSLAFFLRAGDSSPDALSGTNAAARKLFFASLLYLPLLMFLMVVDKM